MSIALLGRFEVSVGQGLVSTFRSDKVRALLAYLAVEAAEKSLALYTQMEHPAAERVRQQLVAWRASPDATGR